MFDRARFRAHDRRRRLKRCGADRAMGTRCRREALRPRCCLGLERENPFRTAGKMDKPLRCWPLDSQRDQEARSVVAFSRVPRWARGAPVSPPAADHGV